MNNIPALLPAGAIVTACGTKSADTTADLDVIKPLGYGERIEGP